MRRSPSAARPRNGNCIVLVLFCVVLVLLPGICGATVAVLAVGSGVLEGQSAEPAMKHHPGLGAGGHRHGDTSDPASEYPTERRAEHCDAHVCCVTGIRSAAFQLDVRAPAAIDPVVPGRASSLASTECMATAFPGAPPPPGPPGLTATNAPQRR